MRCLSAWVLLAVLAAVPPVPGAEPAASPATAEDEQTLRAAHWPVDGPGLLQLFRNRTLTTQRQEQVVALVRELGDNDFPTREKATAALIQLGPVVTPVLRPALHDADVEISRRARFCLDAVEKANDPGLTAAAVRLLRARSPEGAAAVLLAYLPFADDEFTEEEALAALLTLSVQAIRIEPAVLAGLASPAPTTRAGAALVVGQAGNPSQRQLVHQLLNDRAARVRWRAAQGLLAAQEPAAMGTLLALLTEAPLPEAQEAEALLARLAEEQRPKVDLGEDAASRRRAADAWKAWWESHRAGFDWTRAEAAALPANPSRLAREAVQVLIRALQRGDAAGAVRILGLPFLLENEQVLQKTELEALMQTAAKEFQNLKAVFTVKQVITNAEYLRTTDAGFKQILSSRLKGPWLAVIVELALNGAKAERIALIVRVNGSRALIMGVGPVRAEAKP